MGLPCIVMDVITYMWPTTNQSRSGETLLWFLWHGTYMTVASIVSALKAFANVLEILILNNDDAV